ncbi:MAG TPA: hypothetical protein VHN80_04150, partial [Kineosporiaceae bacterium]|nr:hypothetical protein [Kineosporiaceae bacterium]
MNKRSPWPRRRSISTLVGVCGCTLIAGTATALPPTAYQRAMVEQALPAATGVLPTPAVRPSPMWTTKTTAVGSSRSNSGLSVASS